MAKSDTQKFSKELLDQLLVGADPKSAPESGGLIGDLKKALAERMLNAEMDVHSAGEAEAGIPNHRNGSSSKTVLTPEGAMELSIPRDRLINDNQNSTPTTIKSRHMEGMMSNGLDLSRSLG